MEFETHSNRQIGVGLIAFGLSGRIFHAPFLVTNPKFKLVAVYERSKSESLEFAAKHDLSIDLVRSETELVNRDDIELVVVCSPIEFHYEHARLALLAGKHVLVEKAFCASSVEVEWLLELAQKKGLICTPYQNRRYDSDFLTIQKVLKQLGPITEYNGYFNRYNPMVRDNWKDNVPDSGGNFLSLGSHMIDQAVSLFGVPERVWGDIRSQRDGGVLDDAWEVHLYYNSGERDEYGLMHGGFRAILKGSLLCADSSMRYMIHGARGSWIKTGTDTQEAHLMTGALPPYIPKSKSKSKSSDTSTSTSAGGYGWEPEEQWGNLTVAVPSVNGSGTSIVRSRTAPERGSYHHLYDDLYNSIVFHVPLLVDPLHAVTVMRIIEIARLSSRSGGSALPYRN